MRFLFAAIVLASIVVPLAIGYRLSVNRHPSTAGGRWEEAFVVPSHPRGYVCYRAATPLRIDGRLDEPEWQAASWSEPFVDIEGDAKPVPRFRTRVKMLWDDDYFYVGAELEEPHVWATLTRHDSYIFHDDNDFEVFIDPDGDSHDYCEFEINALNTGWDLLLTRPYKDGGRAIDSWEMAGFKSAIHVDGTLNDPSDTDRGWTIELAFPWKVLTELAASKERPKDGDQWRVNFSRVQWQHEVVNGRYCRVPGTKEDNWVWSPQGVVNMHRPETWGYVQFSTAAPGTVTFRRDPAWPAKSVLHAVYYAQHAFRERHGRWARMLGELNMPDVRHDSMTGLPSLEATESLFEAIVTSKQIESGPRRWHIRQDARIWQD
jgi:hypothetical protein